MTTIRSVYYITPDQYTSSRPNIQNILTPDIPQDAIMTTSDTLYYGSEEQYRDNIVRAMKNARADTQQYYTRTPIHQSSEPVRETVTQGLWDKNRPASPASTFKRKPSLRGAARSLRPLKVAKRLRRQGRPDGNNEEGDDAGASASESDGASQLADATKTDSSRLCYGQLPRRQSVVSNLVNGIQNSLAIRSHGRGRGSSSASSATSSTWMLDSSDSASTNTSFTSLSSVFSKRSRQLGHEDFEDDEDNGSDRAGKRPCNTGLLEFEQPQLFACPFAKYDAKRYSAANLSELNYRGCSQSYLTDLARVKQHLYRVHERPQHYCPSCYTVFKGPAQYSKHVAEDACSPRPCPFDEKMTPEQLSIIKRKNRGTNPWSGWYEIFKTLFPGAHPPASPYAAFTDATLDTLETFLSLLQSELPQRLQDQLASRIPMLAQNAGIQNTISAAIRLAIPEILQDVRQKFSQPPQPKTASTHSEPAAIMSRVVENKESVHRPSYHEITTLAQPPSQQAPLARSRRPSAISIPPPTLYGFNAAMSAQHIPDTSLVSTPFDDRPAQQDMDQPYMQPRYPYELSNNQIMGGVPPEPLTAIWQPSEEDSHQGYFTSSHQTEELVPTFPLRLHEDNWIPTMVMTHHDIHNNIGNMFHNTYEDDNTHGDDDPCGANDSYRSDDQSAGL